jgi:hypothetical protein
LTSIDNIRKECEQDLFTYAQVMFPKRYYGDLHRDMFRFFQNSLEYAMKTGDGDNAGALVPRDHQKALTLDTKIATLNGWKYLKDIKVGDRVIGKDGLPKFVQGLHPIAEQPVYEVRLDDGRTLKASGKHLWEVTCPSNTRSKEIIKNTESILKNYISPRFDKRNGKNYEEYRYFVTAPKAVRYTNKDLPIDAYTLGAWLGDGHSHTEYLTTADKEMLEYIPYKITKLKAKHLYKIHGLKPKLKSLNLLNNKHIPELYLQGSVEQREALLQGLMDTDGHVHIKNKNMSYTTISTSLMEDFCELVRSLGGKAKVSSQWTTTSKESTKKHHSYCINVWIPDAIQPCRLKRKLERVQKGQRTKSAIVSITPLGSYEARCITVEDGIFLAENYFKTHNSFCIAIACSWAITKYPWFTASYVSSNPKLAESQLTIIKNIFKGDVHREMWPDMLNYEIHQRTKDFEHKPTGTWTLSEIAVDHPDRPKSEKDPTIRATSAKSTNTGEHYKLCIFDDLVTNENYRSAAEREDIREVYQSYASIATTGSIKWLVGTRYGDNDLYADLKEKEYPFFDDEGNEIERRTLWKWFEAVVENSKNKDGSGDYVWPRQKKYGNWYGFNRNELERKRADAFNLELFYAQYYNDPNAADTDKISNDCFMYLNPAALHEKQGKWYYGEKELKINCGMDLAFSEGSGIKKVKRDYSSVAVTGWDADGYLYVLDLKRFQTDKAEVYYKELIELHTYWGFREATIETNAGGKVVARFIQDEIRKDGYLLVINSQHKNQVHGAKAERNSQMLEPLYRNRSVYHKKGGYTKSLEDELRLSKPQNDDLTDALFIAVSTGKRLVKPRLLTNRKQRSVVNAQSRFLARGRRKA